MDCSRYRTQQHRGIMCPEFRQNPAHLVTNCLSLPAHALWKGLRLQQGTLLGPFDRSPVRQYACRAAALLRSIVTSKPAAISVTSNYAAIHPLPHAPGPACPLPDMGHSSTCQPLRVATFHFCASNPRCHTEPDLLQQMTSKAEAAEVVFTP